MGIIVLKYFKCEKNQKKYQKLKQWCYYYTDLNIIVFNNYKVTVRNYYMNFLSNQNKLRQWTFIFKLVMCFLLFTLSVITTILSVFTEFWYVSSIDQDNFYDTLWMQNFDVMWSFWSTQTVFIINVWFLWALIYHNNEQKNKFTNIYSQTSLTIYITITALIFWISVIINRCSNLDLGVTWFWKLNLKAVIFFFLDHILAPLAMIMYLLITFKKFKDKLNSKKQFLLVMIYPVFYFIYIYLRAVILANNGVKNFLFPYAILNFNRAMIDVPLWINSVLVLLLIGTTICLIPWFYLFLNKYFYGLSQKSNLVKIRSNKHL